LMKEEPKIKCIGNAGGVQTQGRSVYLTSGLCPTLAAGMTHGNTMPFIIEITRLEDGQDKRSRSDG
jgi:hypothetical protein